jgi:predicted enzyme related to lactoylglutathione lyase
VELQWDDLEDNWLPYVKVKDIKSTISKARELGGNLILETKDVAILVDPTGAVFGIQPQMNNLLTNHS